jgi:predicted DNA-binding protein YlxM (UPF0122 family)
VFVLAVNIFVSQLLDCYGKILPEKQHRILDGYYNNDLSLAEIAENEGISRQGVSDFIKRGEAQLTEFEEKLGWLGRVSQLKAESEKVRHGADIKELLSIIDKL